MGLLCEAQVFTCGYPIFSFCVVVWCSTFFLISVYTLWKQVDMIKGKYPMTDNLTHSNMHHSGKELFWTNKRIQLIHYSFISFSFSSAERLRERESEKVLFSNQTNISEKEGGVLK